MKNKFIEVKKYIAQGGGTVEFYPVSDAPGATHKVYVNGERAGWLSEDFKPNRKAAQFFLDKVNNAN